MKLKKIFPLIVTTLMFSSLSSCANQSANITEEEFNSYYSSCLERKGKNDYDLVNANGLIQENDFKSKYDAATLEIKSSRTSTYIVKIDDFGTLTIGFKTLNAANVYLKQIQSDVKAGEGTFNYIKENDKCGFYAHYTSDKTHFEMKVIYDSIGYAYTFELEMESSKETSTTYASFDLSFDHYRNFVSIDMSNFIDIYNENLKNRYGENIPNTCRGSGYVSNNDKTSYIDDKDFIVNNLTNGLFARYENIIDNINVGFVKISHLVIFLDYLENLKKESRSSLLYYRDGSNLFLNYESPASEMDIFSLKIIYNNKGYAALFYNLISDGSNSLVTELYFHGYRFAS